MSGVTDIVSEGHEFEVILNPTRSWRIAFNAAKSVVIRGNTGTDMLQVVNSLVPIMQEELARPTEQRSIQLNLKNIGVGNELVPIWPNPTVPSRRIGSTNHKSGR